MPSVKVSRAFADVGRSSAGRPAATGRGERRFALATLRLSAALGVAHPARRILPLVEMPSAPAASWPSTASSPSSGPFAVNVSRPGPLSATTKRSSPTSSTRAAPSSPARRALTFTFVAASAARLSRLRASPAAPASPSSATRNAPARPTILNLPVALGSITSEARNTSGVRRPAERRSCSAACGANFSKAAVTPSRPRASRSSVNAPRGGCALVSMRPLSANAAPPKSATASWSISSPWTPSRRFTSVCFASTPAMSARPILSDSAPRRGQSNATPPSTALATRLTRSRSMSGAVRAASSRAG